MPGSSWDAVVAFVPSSQGIEVWHSSDMDVEKPSVVDVLKDAKLPRDLVRYLVEDGGVSCGGDFYYRARVTGAKGAWADLLRLAWMHDDEAELHVAAGDILALDDQQIHELWEDLHGFGPDEATKIRDLVRAAEEEAALQAPVLTTLARGVPPGPLTMKGLKGELRKAKAKERRASAKAVAVREKKLLPFRAAIEEALAGWEAMNPNPRRSISEMGWRARRGVVSRFLEEYVLQHGAMPIGPHDLGNGPWNVVVGVHDFTPRTKAGTP